METADDEDDLKLVRASASLLADLEASLPKLLWKRSKTGSGHGAVHRRVRRRDLEHVIRLIEPFQGEPQLLDARLKHIVPSIVEAYLQYVTTDRGERPSNHPDLQVAICTIFYALCKVRGYKVILGFFNNEPRYLEPILNQLDEATSPSIDGEIEWQVQYILTLWTAHLMLVPFDLASISPPREADDHSPIPVLVERVQNIGTTLLSSPTKTQDAAAFLLLRLVTRPDTMKLGLCQSVTTILENAVSVKDSAASSTSIYEPLGLLRFYAAISATELHNAVADIYRKCRTLDNTGNTVLAGNAVAKKLFIKIYRNTVIQALGTKSNHSPLATPLETSGLVEDVIDHLLLSLCDRDTPVRYAAAKALSRIVLHLQPEMGYEVIQAVLESFKEDMSRRSEVLDFRTVNPLKWHGLTLTLAHMLFKRSAAVEQLQDIVSALVSALQFEQRTATGSSVGTNVRDAANFGLWALSRRYATEDLVSIDSTTLLFLSPLSIKQSVLQTIATQLVLSACLDPVGNVRRGSSAALQELVGRHPNQIAHGIALVQIVDYQAVGLRRRAMVDVAARAAELTESRTTYWSALVDGLIGWRGIGSPDVASRESTAAAFARLSTLSIEGANKLLATLREQLLRKSDIEDLHGLLLSTACLLEEIERSYNFTESSWESLSALQISHILEILVKATESTTTRVLRSELSASIARFGAAICKYLLSSLSRDDIPADSLETLTKRLLARHEDTIQLALPPYVACLLALKRARGLPLGCLGAQALSRKVAVDGSKSTLNGACGAIGLGALASQYSDGLVGDSAILTVRTMAGLAEAMNVDWRIVGIKALRLTVESLTPGRQCDEEIARIIVNAVHRSLNDYTIDERGDIGSLVRLQAIACTSCIFATPGFAHTTGLLEILRSDIYRLSLEKLDRVRLEAAQCCAQYLKLDVVTTDVTSVTSQQYFITTLSPLLKHESAWKHRALLEGCISCAGVASDPVLEASRFALAYTLHGTSAQHLLTLLSTFATILKSLLLETINNCHPALELLAFLLDMQIPQRVASNSDFRWRSLLSTVQKSHHKSNDIAKILAAVQVYRGLAGVEAIKGEVMKKLISMLKTNPYPRVRVSVADTLFVLTGEDELRARDWTRPAKENMDTTRNLEARYVDNQ